MLQLSWLFSDPDSTVVSHTVYIRSKLTGRLVVDPVFLGAGTQVRSHFVLHTERVAGFLLLLFLFVYLFCFVFVFLFVCFVLLRFAGASAFVSIFLHNVGQVTLCLCCLLWDV